MRLYKVRKNKKKKKKQWRRTSIYSHMGLWVIINLQTLCLPCESNMVMLISKKETKLFVSIKIIHSDNTRSEGAHKLVSQPAKVCSQFNSFPRVGVGLWNFKPFSGIRYITKSIFKNKIRKHLPFKCYRMRVY